MIDLFFILFTEVFVSSITVRHRGVRRGYLARSPLPESREGVEGYRSGVGVRSSGGERDAVMARRLGGLGGIWAAFEGAMV